MNNNTTDQIYDNGLLLGALLRITGLSILEVQAIIQGNLILKNKHDNIRALILDDSEWKNYFAIKIFKSGINLSDINHVFETAFTDFDFTSNLYNPNFYLNQVNFTLKECSTFRKKIIKILKEKYDYSNNQIASFLDISATTVAKEVQ